MNIDNEIISQIFKLFEENSKEAYGEVEQILKENKINPCEVIVNDANYTLLAFSLLHYGAKAFSLMVKYSDESKTPPNARSPWTTAIFDGKLSTLKKMAEAGTTTLNAPTDLKNVPSNFAHFVKRNLPKPNLKESKISKFINDRTIFLLDLGADINTYLDDNHVCMYWLRNFGHRQNIYEEILDTSLKYNFNPNIKFHHNTDNNFLQHFFAQVATKDNKLWQNKILNKVLSKNHIDFTYKNKDNQTLIELLHSRLEKSKISEECLTTIENMYLNQTLNKKAAPALKNRL